MFIWLKRRRFQLATLLMGSVLLGAGVYLNYLYFYPTTEFFDPTLGGFGYATNSTNLTPLFLNIVMYTNTEPPSLYFQFGFTSNTTQTCNFIFQFPFHTYNKQGYLQFSIKPNDKGSSVEFQYPIDGNSTINVIGYLSIDKTYQSGSRGTYIMTFPFSGIISSADISQTQSFNMQVQPLSNINFYIVMPFNCHISQTFPAFSVVPNHMPLDSYFENSSLSRVVWKNITLDNDITVMYENSNDSSKYEQFLFLSGIFYGGGVSIITGIIYDTLKKHFDQEDTDRFIVTRDENYF